MDHSESPTPDRRTVLAVVTAGAGVALAGCSSYGSAQSTAAPASGAAAAPGSASGAAAGSGAALASLSDVPVGGGTILKADKLVLTQPTAGTVKAFSAICTHQGCVVAEVVGGTINCPCHGSKFKIADGSVAGGPAPKPLPEVPVTLQGDKIVRG